jgi:hypothetical protein
MILRNCLVAVLVSGCLVFDAQPSLASFMDLIIHTGAECSRVTGGTSAKTSLGVLENSHSTSGLWTYCPIVRVQDWYEVTTVSLVVNDNHGSIGVSCKLYCFDDGSASFDSTASQTTTGTGDYKTLSLSNAGLTTWENGKCYAQCFVPDTDSGTSGIVSYSVTSDEL